MNFNKEVLHKTYLHLYLRDLSQYYFLKIMPNTTFITYKITTDKSNHTTN